MTPTGNTAGGRLFNTDALANPYPLYHQLRSFSPVHWVEAMNGWLVTRYDDVAAALRNLKLSSTARKYLLQRKIADPEVLAMVELRAPQMLFSDPPAHTRMRGLVSKAFTPRAVEAMAGRLQKMVDAVLDAVQPKGGMDIIRDLAYPLPVTVIAEMLGVPPEDRPRFKGWSDALTVLVNSVGDVSPEQYRTAAQARGEFINYLRGIVAQRRAAPRDDLLTALVQAEDAGDRLSEDELYANSLLLMSAGHETTTNLIGNGVLALLRHPDQLQKLRDNPTLLPGAVEELLRYDSPVQLTARIALEDVEVGGTRVQKGQFTWLILGAANRDPGHFPDPDRLDVTRKDVKHLSFGAGIHFCLGAPLARLEGQIALGTLIRRFPNLRLAKQELHYHDNFTLHGLTSLAVEF
jgi:cytochrome P450